MPDVRLIDLHYLGIPQAIAAHVVLGPDGPVLIETGPASTLDHLQSGLAQLNLSFADIKHALVTHIHLDHAGAAGHLAQHGAQIYVHHFGARHLIDPAKLIESATRIYGDQMDRLWGRMVPVPPQRITPLHDGDVLELCGLRLTAIETPGHARHHHALAMEDICFAGDAAGIVVPTIPQAIPGAGAPAARFIAVPTPPPEFDLPAWLVSIDRLIAGKFTTIYLTHFGPRHHSREHLRTLRAAVRANADFVRLRLQQGLPRETILRQYIDWVRADAAAAGVNDLDFARYCSTNLLTMNVDGMIRYWSKAIGVAPRSGLPS